MKVLLTFAFEGDGAEFVEAMGGELEGFVDGGGAERSAIDVKATGEELEMVKILDSDPTVTAMVSLWEPASVERALALPLPEGARLAGAYRVDEVIRARLRAYMAAGRNVSRSEMRLSGTEKAGNYPCGVQRTLATPARTACGATPARLLALRPKPHSRVPG